MWIGLLALLSLISTADGSPPRQVVLLTSVAVPEKPVFFLRSYYRDYHLRLERIFRKRFETLAGHELVVKHFADQHDLWDAVSSPRSAAVFWVSHAGEASSGVGAGADDLIADIHGGNVLPVFQGTHPDLRVLAIVGCRTTDIVERMRAKGLFAQNPGLTILSFDRKRSARAALKSAAKQAHAVLSTPDKRGPADCLSAPGYRIHVKRTLPSDADAIFPAARLEMKGRVLGVFPIGRAGETQELEVALRVLDLPTRGDLRLAFDSGAALGNRALRLRLGALEVSEPWSGASWRLFSRRDGTPFGVTRHLYEFSGPLVPPSAPEDLPLFSCAP